jgi:hypothetical protein
MRTIAALMMMAVGPVHYYTVTADVMVAEMTGPRSECADSCCGLVDRDGDADVDLSDFAMVQNAWKIWQPPARNGGTFDYDPDNPTGR